MDMQELIESLSPIEKKVTPFLSLQSFDEIIEKSGLDRVSVLRALEFLNSKKVIELKIEKKKIIDLGTNGIYYKKKGLPERQLLLIAEQGPVSLQNAQKQSRLSDNEFKAAIGALKKKALADIKNGRLIFTGDKSDIVKKSLEEQFIDLLPLEFDNISAEQKFSLDKLKDRKDIVIITEEQVVSFTLTKLGKDLVKEDLSKIDLIEELTSEMIQKESWKGKKFRRYDVESQVPKINGGKEHFVNQTIDYGRRVWTEMGFKEMKGSLIQESFWNFDALFTAQDHPVRDLQDTFFINSLGDLGKYGKVVDSVKKSHEQGVDGNKGWGGKWNTKEAEKLVLRTHTTCLSAKTLYELSKLPKEQRRGKFFAIGKCFRNETVDWKHGFEFNQTEGIVIDKDANFQNLLGYLKEFFNKMGFPKVRFRPHYFPYTEPSVEIDAWHPVRNEWIELGGAGIFRPEVTIALLGEWIPVLAWGPGFDRILMDYYEIKDLRELYGNDIKQLRNIKIWKK
ncbi:phenylalanine--tRNA ligase subunit alpha [Candidatus Pacearchaeota archaeon]|nr:phenylalanine--tRNA ligase subunit alpha [Candidatus Pacearchaeota archaeon]